MSEAVDRANDNVVLSFDRHLQNIRIDELFISKCGCAEWSGHMCCPVKAEDIFPYEQTRLRQINSAYRYLTKIANDAYKNVGIERNTIQTVPAQNVSNNPKTRYSVLYQIW